jgi:twitching motility protein PilI
LAERISLRQFQEALNRRIAEARTGALDEVRLAVQAGRCNWLVRLPDVGEVVSVPKLVPVPRTQPWYRGVANARGSLYGVVDLAAFLGEAAAEAEPAARLLLIGRRHGALCALLVERVLGLRKLSDFTPEPPGEGGDAWAGPAFRDGAGQTWVQLEVAALLHTDRFLQIAA